MTVSGEIRKTRRMLFMVIERYTQGPEPVYQRAAEKGRMLPDGLRYVDSWIVDDGAFDRCFQLMETDDPTPVRRVARELARPRRLRSAPRHQIVRRRRPGRRDMDRRALSVSHLGRAARPASSSSSSGRGRRRWRRRGRRRSSSARSCVRVVGRRRSWSSPDSTSSAPVVTWSSFRPAGSRGWAAAAGSGSVDR